MKVKIPVLCLAAAAMLASPALCAEFLEDFEAYEAGSPIAEQSAWTTWDANPLADTIVTDEEAYSGEKSLLLTGSCDIVRIFRTVSYGMCTVKAQVFVSSEQAGVTYFLLLNTYNHNGPYNWSVQLGMDPAKGTITSELSGQQTLPLVTDDWVEIVVELDLDNNLHSIYYDGQPLAVGATWTTDGKHALEAIDLYSADNPGNKTYIDDVEVGTELCVPVEIVRTGVSTAGTTTLIEGVEAPAYGPGDTLAVTLTMSSVRGDKIGCPPLGDVTVSEHLPEGWTATEISDGGVFDNGAIVWRIPAAQLAPGQLTYKASGPVTRATLGISGTIAEKGNALMTPIGGNPIPTALGGLSADGMLLSWLLLGPYMTTGTATTKSAALMSRDYLTDGEDITEASVMPADGDEVETNYSKAASLGLAAASGPGINPGGIPQWFAWRDRDVQVNFDDAKLFGAVDNVMAYAVCYVCAKEDLEARLAAGSDDSIQILVNDKSVWINAVERGWPGLVDLVPVSFTKGRNRLMVKVFETGGGWNFGVSLTDEIGEPFDDDRVVITLDPEGCGTPPPLDTFMRGDANADGKLDIADAVRVLGYLFGGGATTLDCLDAADANDDGKLDVADAVKILGHLFAATGPLPQPFGACGPDPSDDALGCVKFAPCGTGI